MLKNFKATSTKARPEDIQHPVGVSERIKNIVENAEETPAIEEPQQEDRGDVKKIMEEVAGNHGTFKLVLTSFLEPTPEEWNRFTPVSDEKKILMADSIYRNGLQQPIVVRKLDRKRYQILAGNTRTEIYRILHNLTQDEKYFSIPAIVYDEGQISDDQAKEIVSDTNFVQRAELSKSDRAFAIHTKVESLRKRGTRAALDKVAEEFNLERTSVFYWDKIFNLIPQFFEMYENDEIDTKAAARLGCFPVGIQEDLYKEKDLLTSEVIMKIPASTMPGKVLDKLHAVLEKISQPPIQYAKGSYSIRDTSSGYSITVQGKMEEDRKPVLLFLPEKKLKSFMKKYEDFILDMES